MCENIEKKSIQILVRPMTRILNAFTVTVEFKILSGFRWH